MRKITREAVDAFMNDRGYTSGNTSVKVDQTTNKTVLSLHSNDIARKLRKNSTIEITLAGWNTNTTRERLNGIPGVRVTTKRGQAFLNGEPWDGEWQVV
jgi:hypothetical protein